MDLPQMFSRATDEFGRRVRVVSDDQWGRSTPCPEWSVRDLVNHLVNENAWVPHLLAGKTVEDLGDSLDGDLLRDDPQGAWSRAAAGAIAAIAEPGALDRTTHLSFGDFPAPDYVGQVLTDHVIHAWDLARAIGANESLDPELVSFAYDTLEPQVEQWRAGGAFGQPQEVPNDADLQIKLLGMTGRKA